MSCYLDDTRIVVGRTKKKALITVCKGCGAYRIPHFNYISKRYKVTLSLLSPEFVDSFENIELDERTDLEEFLNTIVTCEQIRKSNQEVPKLNRQFFRNQKRFQRKWKERIASPDGDEMYFTIDEKEVEEDMSYWELIVKLWNTNNEEKVPANNHKPYYRNFVEYIDSCGITNKKEQQELLDGARIYTQLDQERKPNFHYTLKTGEDFCLSMEKAIYLEPIPRTLSEEEIERLVHFLKRERKLKNGEKYSNWEAIKSCWEDQNFGYNEYAPKWFPKYKKLEMDTPMPDYTKINEPYS